ncbi:MAG: glycosyltransferase family 4 protein [Candidatus Deferrimicrobiaceae bacterium]|jgi:glycosyltransferase involved in cell wall biosynthesis|nr:glycosyltransferase family 4 protein [Candidatus Deferrimicrobiaceae bacterium]
MTVLYPVPEPLPGKSARFIQIVHTCHALARAGCAVRLMTGLRPGIGEEELFRHYGLEPVEGLAVVRLPVLRGAVSWNAPFHLSFLMHARKREGAVIFARYLKLAHFLIRTRRVHRLPVVFEAHEIFHRTTENPGKAGTLQEMESLVYRESDAVIAITSALGEEIASLFGRQVEKVIPDGVRADFLAVPRSGRGTGILYLGQLYPWKGVDVLIRALRFLEGERVTIVGGEGERARDLERLAVEEGVAGRVEFRGTVPHAEVRKFLEEARVAVLPNLAGGVSRFTSPLKLFEYMAAGVPVVASDLPAFREVLRDGENAVLVPPGDPEALAAGIGRVLEDEALASRIAARAREEAAEYTWDRRAGKIREVLENLRR